MKVYQVEVYTKEVIFIQAENLFDLNSQIDALNIEGYDHHEAFIVEPNLQEDEKEN